MGKCIPSFVCGFKALATNYCCSQVVVLQRDGRIKLTPFYKVGNKTGPIDTIDSMFSGTTTLQPLDNESRPKYA